MIFKGGRDDSFIKERPRTANVSIIETRLRGSKSELSSLLNSGCKNK